MKWVYKICRLVFGCPHRWIEVDSGNEIFMHNNGNQSVIAQFSKLKCRYCGDINRKRWRTI